MTHTDDTFTFTPITLNCGRYGCRASLVIEGWVYECSCGEHYQSVEHASRCRKCRTYTEEGYCTEVVDIRSESTVWDIGVHWASELAGALDKPRSFHPTLADVWPASL